MEQSRGPWENDITNPESPDFSIVLGGGATFPVGGTRAGVEIRYQRGLARALSDAENAISKSSDDGVAFADAQGRGEKMRHVVISIMVIALLPFQFL